MLPAGDLSSPTGYLLRSPVPVDVDAIAAVVVADELADSGHSTLGLAFVQGEWSRPEFDPAGDAWAAVDQTGVIVGYGHVKQVDPAMVESWGVVHPGHRGRGIGGALLDRIERRAAQMLTGVSQGRFRHAVNARDAGVAGLLRARGLAPVRHFWHMQIDLDTPLWPSATPEGVKLAGIEPPEGLKTVYQVIDTALAANWDHHAQPFDEWVEEMTGVPGYDPALWVLATVDGKPAGAVTASLWEDTGWIDYLGVLDAHRGRGIAGALLRHSFGQCADRGARRVLVSVDSENATGATGVYERAGMRVMKAWNMWERTILDGRSLG